MLRVTASLILLVGLLALSRQSHAAPPAGTDWVDTFTEEFNGTALDTNVWTSGRQSSADDPGADEARGTLLSDGILHLVTRHHDGNTREWTASSISPRHFRQRYGYWEVRMRFARATGLNNLILLTSDGLPRSARTDIVMVEGRYPNRIVIKLRQPSLHIGTMLYSINTTDFSADYHLYGLSWLPDGKGSTHLIWYFDGFPVHEADCTECTQAMRLWIGTHVTTWAGPFAPVTDGASMDVDYVRVYQARGLAGR